jgi:hypothetical protein
MTTFEKTYSVLAIFFACALIQVLIFHPEYRQIHTLLPISLLGLLVNIGLMYIVFHDVYLRRFTNPAQRIIWIAILLVFWPAILIYLPMHGFHKRPATPSPPTKR